jgi:2-oxoisovalerate dehydrogenase E2 component (dihydrolipoyl transacylase)
MEDFLIPDRARIAAALRSLARVDRAQRAAALAVDGRTAPPSAGVEKTASGAVPVRSDTAWPDLVVGAARDIPQAASVVEVDLSRAVRRLEAERDAWLQRGLNPDLTALFAEALLAAVREVPQANAAFDAERRGIRRYSAVHLALSVAGADGAAARHGVVRDADTRNALGLAMEIEAIRSADGSSDAGVLAEGTLSLADYGPGSALYGVPLVLPGQVAAVRVGAVEERLLVRERGFGLAPTAYVCASIDHRALDGMDAGALLGAMKRFLERE